MIPREIFLVKYVLILLWQDSAHKVIISFGKILPAYQNIIIFTMDTLRWNAVRATQSHTIL